MDSKIILTYREEQMSEELTKFHVLGLPFSAVIHRFTGPDKGDPHDHPFDFTAFVMEGEYVEKRYELRTKNRELDKIYHRKKGDSFRVTASTVHQIIELPKGECWTIILPERGVKKPGFYRLDKSVLHRFWDENTWHIL